MAVHGTVGGAKADDYNTLDEPIKETIVRLFLLFVNCYKRLVTLQSLPVESRM